MSDDDTESPKDEEEPEDKETADEEEDDDDALNPVGIEFWLGQIFMVAFVLVAVWVAAKAGFNEAADFQRYEKLRRARNAVRVIRVELEANLRGLREAKKNLEANRQASVHIEDTYLTAGESDSALSSLVGPYLFSSIRTLFAPPFAQAMQAAAGSNVRPRSQMTDRRRLDLLLLLAKAAGGESINRKKINTLLRQQGMPKERVIQYLATLLERAQKRVLPMLQSKEEEIERELRRLGEEP